MIIVDNRLLKRIIRLVGKAIGDFGLIEDGDRILVALSGGKDSWTLLHALRHLQKKAPVKFEIAAVTVHPGAAEFSCESLTERLAGEGVPYTILPGRIVEIVRDHLDTGTGPCSFCARLRRGVLYSYASAQGWNKIALGHHLDDFIETLLMNLFYNGSIKGMNPLLAADDGKNTVIRPLVYVREDITREYALSARVPILGCSCPYHGMSSSRRHWVKELLTKIEKEIPDVKSNLLASMGRVHERHLFQPTARSPKMGNDSPAEGG